MRKHFIIACLYTLSTAVLLGVVYPLLITGLAQLTMHDKADGQLLEHNGVIVGSAILGQPFTGPSFFHSRPSSAGTGYDGANSSGSNLAPTSKTLVDRVDASVKAEEATGPVPVDLVTTSASGLDPDISIASALYQVARVAKERHLPEASVQQLVQQHITGRQFGVLGEPRVNVLQLNLALTSSPTE